MALIDSEEFRRRALQVYPEYWEDVLDEMPSVDVQEVKQCEYWDSESKFCALRRPADVQEMKRGRWIYWDKNRVMCSECKLEPYAGKGADSFKYCPHCGAKMEA